ncbi:MAG: hypothetical protein WDA26_07210, partial [Pusillimonas sp.]
MKKKSQTYTVYEPSVLKQVNRLGMLILVAAVLFGGFFVWMCEEPTAIEEIKQMIMKSIIPVLQKAILAALMMIFSYFAFLGEFVFDGNKKLFIYKKAFFFVKSSITYGSYTDIDAITISYFFKPNKSARVMMTVILKNGKNVETENFDPKLYSQRIEVINNKAKELADTIG